MELHEQAAKYAPVEHRTIPKQIEYWAKIGKIAEENPDLTIDAIKDILLALEEEKHGMIKPFVFSEDAGKK